MSVKLKCFINMTCLGDNLARRSRFPKFLKTVGEPSSKYRSIMGTGSEIEQILFFKSSSRIINLSEK